MLSAQTHDEIGQCFALNIFKSSKVASQCKWRIRQHATVGRPLANNHFLYQWWPSSLTHMCVTEYQRATGEIDIVAGNAHHISKIIYHILQVNQCTAGTNTFVDVYGQIANGNAISSSIIRHEHPHIRERALANCLNIINYNVRVKTYHAIVPVTL